MIRKLLKYSSPPQRTLRGKTAFTLMEVILAVMVLAFGIAGTLVAIRIGFGMVETARDQTLASQFMQSEIETLRLKNWAELSALPAEEIFPIDSDFDPTVVDRFVCTRRIEEARPGVGVKSVTIRATWHSTNGVERELQYMTRIAKDGLNDYYYRSQ